MTTEVLQTSAVLELLDRFSPGLDKLISGLTKAEGQVAALQTSLNRLGIGGVAGLSTKIEGEWSKIGKITETGVDTVLQKIGRLGAESSPLFAEMTKGAKTAFGEIGTEAGLMKDTIVDQLRYAGTFGPAALAQGIATSAPGMFAPIVEASKLASAEAAGNIARIAGAVQAAGAEGTLERNLLGSQTRAAGAGGFGRTRSAGHGGGLHMGRVGGELPGTGMHLSTSGNGALAAAGLMLGSVIEAAEVADVLAKAGITGQLDMSGDFLHSKPAMELANLIKKTSSMTSFSLKQSGEAFLGTERMLGGTDFKTRMSVMDTILPYAGFEAKMKEGTSLEDSFESFIGLAHMTGEYRPEKLKELAKQFAFTSINTNMPLPQFEKTLSYSLPMLHNTMGMDAGGDMLMTMMAANAGISSTKSGTWIRSFFQGVEPAMGEGKAAEEHNSLLRRFGLNDDQDHPTWRKQGADGQTDWTSSILDIAGKLDKSINALPVDERLNTLKNLFGERGGGFAAIMANSNFIEQLPVFASKLKNFQGADKSLDDYAQNSTDMKARQTFRDFEIILADIGDKLLPTVNAGLTAFDLALKALPGDWEATKKMWSDRAAAVESIFTGGSHAGQRPQTMFEKAWGLQHPGVPMPADGSSLKAAYDLHGVVEDRATRAKAADAPSPSWWHSIFGAAADPAKDAGQKFGDLNTRTGFVLTSFGGLDQRSGTLSTQFTNLGTGTGALANDLRILEATSLGAARALATVAMSGGAGGGSGFTNASWGGGGSPDLSGAFRGGGAGIGHLFSAADREKNIRSYAASIGISPDVAMAVAKSEGFGKFSGDRNTSFGDLQMHIGGGLGDTFRRATGKDPSDPHNELALDRFALDQARAGGWGPWHGAARIGVHGRYGIGSAPTVDGRRTVAPGHSAAGQQAATVIVNQVTNIDGKTVAKSSTKHVVQMLAQAMAHPTTTGGPSGRIHYTHAGTPITDAA